MSTSEFENLWERVQSLTPDEQREMCERLSRPINGESRTEEDLDQALVREGLLASAPQSVTTSRWQPLVIKGEPISRTVIQERR